ncbi:hypothetical protein EJM73_09370 [Clostridium botulinum]|uniref:hypothetical protein n=1 Tax=Clostridium botulinum TaxID=1491 RepID=UPI0013761ADB|nr:hypothetical protein [Clostridium botulinum]NCI19835.1 hypothetical protein [Clostridium botulinum]NCI35873.1 hypothetical protein [Clostridium botulinum]NCI71730.1 hypothetical protein [Clostridium botulinum]NDI38646.1 hypothetical protein [Clostridium botulinum]
MNCFLEREIKGDLDLIKRHIKKVEYELLTFDIETYYPEEFVHLYETYQRLMRIYTDNSSDVIEDALDFYIKRRNKLYRIKDKLKDNMDSLFGGNRRKYEKLIYTYEDIIKQYKALYETVRYLEVKTIKKLDISEVAKIDCIEIKNFELYKEILNQFQSHFNCSLIGHHYKDKDNNVSHAAFTIKSREVRVKFNKDIEFNIVFKNEKVMSNGEIVLVGNKDMIKKHRINFKNDSM